MIKLPTEDFIQIPLDHPLGDSGGLYVRYGNYSGAEDYIEVIDQNGNPAVSSSGFTAYVMENREGPWKPAFVTWNPFESLNFKKGLHKRQFPYVVSKKTASKKIVSFSLQLRYDKKIRRIQISNRDKEIVSS